MKLLQTDANSPEFCKVICIENANKMQTQFFGRTNEISYLCSRTPLNIIASDRGGYSNNRLAHKKKRDNPKNIQP